MCCLTHCVIAWQLGESPIYEAYLGKRAPCVMLMARRGAYLSAAEQDRLHTLFRRDRAGLRLLALPHLDALRRLRDPAAPDADLL